MAIREMSGVSLKYATTHNDVIQMAVKIMETATLNEKHTGTYTMEEIEYYFHKAVFNVTYIIYRQEDMSMKKKRLAFCIQYYLVSNRKRSSPR